MASRSDARLGGKIGIVTGAARGIGAALARHLVAEGARVVLADVRDSDGELLAKELGESARYHRLDVADEQAWAELTAAVGADHGRIDFLISNAAVSKLGSLQDIPLADIDLMWQVNQRGVLLGMRAVTGWMLPAGSGSIVNVASAATLRVQPGMVGYAATKAAVCAMTKVAALELAGVNIRVNAILPGLIDTPGRDAIPASEKAKRPAVPLRRLGSATEVAHVAAFLASDEASYVTGSEFVVDGGFVL
ncbi:SDR family NAD(P)-dependent oxidoreductase [Mycolicibacterium sp.]|uniref:SDR family NAD(P)-dependent oxidoreductase n=1 Tax=Mycolicibacterium sp. TaxID=2320850 RepID=UPI003D0C90D0